MLHVPVVFCFGEIISEKTVSFHCTDMYNISNFVVFRDVFRRLFGSQNDEQSYLKVSPVSPILAQSQYAQLGHNACVCL